MIFASDGALNVSSQVLLSVNPDWRWKLGEIKSSWYESVQLVRAENIRSETYLGVQSNMVMCKGENNEKI